MSGILIAIPARSGSKAVVDKNIRPLGEHPLIAYSIAAAKLVPKIDRIIVSTDSVQYAQVSQAYGAEVPFLRPAELSGDNNTDYEWVKHLLAWLKEHDNYQPNIVVHLRATTPFREPAVIEQAISTFLDQTEANALRSSHLMSQSSYKTLEVENGYYKTLCSGLYNLDEVNRPRQEFPATYDPNGYVDIYKTSYILANGRLLGNKVFAFETPKSAEVDTIEDFHYLEFLLSRNPHFSNRLFDVN
nr:acylneuraminate cytidylyltransferase family protein [uncultured Desulfobacter sp.]